MRCGTLLLVCGLQLLMIPVKASVGALPPGVSLELTWGTFGQGPGEFHQPRGVSVAPNGNVFVLDTQNVRVQVFTEEGVFLYSWGEVADGDSAFNRATDLVVDTNGQVAICQEDAGSVNVFDPFGSFIMVMGQIGGPQAITVDGSGFFLVGEGERSQIRKLDPQGVSVGRFGQGIFGYESPGGLAVNALGNVLASDTFNNRILTFDASGVYVTSWGSNGTGPSQFKEPRGIAIAQDGTVYVADTGNQRVQALTPDGRFRLAWGSFGLNPGEFRYPWDIAVDNSGAVYVTDLFNHRVQKFRIDFSKSGDLASGHGMTWGQLKAKYLAGSPPLTNPSTALGQ